MNEIVRSGTWRVVERLVWAAGLLAAAVWFIASILGTTGTQRELARFEAARAERPAVPAVLPALSPPDQTLWSPIRRREWKESAALSAAATPIAVLRIRRVGLEVPVLEGTAD